MAAFLAKASKGLREGGKRLGGAGGRDFQRKGAKFREKQL